MTLENTFYVMSIITMSLNFLVLIAIAILLVFIIKKMASLAEQIEEKVDIIKYAVNHPAETAKTVGTAVAVNALEEVVKRVKAKKKT